MMSETLSVRILDQEFTVACPPDEQDYLLQSAHYLDKKMRELASASKLAQRDRIAVIAALNIAHELLQERGQREKYVAGMNKRIRHLQERIDAALDKNGTDKAQPPVAVEKAAVPAVAGSNPQLDLVAQAAAQPKPAEPPPQLELTGE